MKSKTLRLAILDSAYRSESVRLFKKELGAGSGIRIRTAANQKLGLFGVAQIAQPSGEDQQAVTLQNVESAIGGLTFSNPRTQAELQTLSKCAKC